MKHNYLTFQFITIWFFFVASIVAREAIIDGKEAGIQYFSYHISLLTGNKPFCNGAMVTKDLVITAARCVVDDGGQIEKKRIFVLAGTVDLDKRNTPAALREVQKVYVSTDYVPFFVNPVGDIALLKVKDPFELTVYPNMRTVSLPRTNQQKFVGKHAKVSGYGLTSINHQGSVHNNTRLRYAETTILIPGQHGCPIERVHEKQICAKVLHLDNAVDGPCNGDLGDPLVYDGHLLIGILSGIPPGCSEKDIVTTYTRVSAYATFINNVKHDKVTKNMNVLELIPSDN